MASLVYDDLFIMGLAPKEKRRRKWNRFCDLEKRMGDPPQKKNVFSVIFILYPKNGNGLCIKEKNVCSVCVSFSFFLKKNGYFLICTIQAWNLARGIGVNLLYYC